MGEIAHTNAVDFSCDFLPDGTVLFFPFSLVFVSLPSSCLLYYIPQCHKV